MRIALNLLQLEPNRPEGVATYVRKLIEHIQPLLDDELLYVFCQPGLDITAESKRVKVIVLKSPYRATFINRVRRKINNLDKAFKFNSRLDRLVRELRIDIIHYPFSTVPPEDMKLAIPIVLTVVDIQHEFFPQFFTEAELNGRKLAFKPSCDKATKIISISNYTRATLIDRFSLDPDKVKTIYLAGSLVPQADKRIKLPKHYVYYPAASWPHKNHRNLLKAIRILVDRYKFDGQLVLNGLVTPNFKSLESLANQLGIKDRVTHLGQLNPEQLRAAFNKSALLVFPSLFEGFGIPVVEAMSVGIPVACSNTTSLPEAAGKAAIYFDPINPKQIAAAIDRVWNDHRLQQELRRKGYQQSKKFSWGKMAKETLALYREVNDKE